MTTASRVSDSRVTDAGSDMSGEPFMNEGLWTHVGCPLCRSITEIEGDVRGEVVQCENCGYEATIE